MRIAAPFARAVGVRRERPAIGVTDTKFWNAKVVRFEGVHVTPHLDCVCTLPSLPRAPLRRRSRHRRAACKCGSLSASWPQHRRRRSRQSCVRDWRLSTPRSQQLSCLTRSSPRVLAWSAAGLLQVPLPRTQPHSWRLRRALKRPLRRYENCQRPLAVARLASDYYDPRFRVLSATVPSSRHLQQGHR